MTKINFRLWRIANLILIVSGVLLPWVKVVIDPVDFMLPPTPGWRFMLGIWNEILISRFRRGHELDMVLVDLLGISGVFIILYALFNAFLIKKNVPPKKGTLVAGGLLGIVIIFLLLIVVGRPLSGYWLLNLGIVSSAILEWKISNLAYQQDILNGSGK